jgi:outer membrane cobalamin receptor
VVARSAVQFGLSLGIVLLGACAHGAPKQSVDDQSTSERVITKEQIAESGAKTAWDVLRRYAGGLTADRRDGSPGRLQRRGRSSIYLNDGPVVYVDGVHMPDARNLQYVPAQDIELIRIISGIRGTTYYGTNAGNGVILVETKSSN